MDQVEQAPSMARLAAAKQASDAKDWSRAAELWLGLRQESPNDLQFSLKAAEACREAAAIEDAERILGEALVRFPDDSRPAVQHARLAETRRDWEAAGQRWDVVIRRFPEIPNGYLGKGKALRACGKRDEAEAVLATAIARFPQRRSVATCTKL